jgi:putative sigma-54 modulation protein
MNVKYHAIHFDISEKLQAYAEKKVSKLAKLTDEIVSTDIYFKVVKPETACNKEVEIKIAMPNAELFSSKISDSFEESIDNALEAIEKQIKKYKEKARN